MILMFDEIGARALLEGAGKMAICDRYVASGGSEKRNGR